MSAGHARPATEVDFVFDQHRKGDMPLDEQRLDWVGHAVGLIGGTARALRLNLDNRAIAANTHSARL